LDLVIPPGQTVALVGATGAGKSTFAKLVARFYDPTSGRVLVDGHDLRSVDSHSLRSQMGIVPQEAFLFSGTVFENIAFGRPDAGLEEVAAAARAVGAASFIEGLEYGYQSEIGERGIQLSAGQRQLIAFARALLADPAVLILDEASSSLDAPTERLVQRALKTVLVDRTALIIAHRLSTVGIADRVLMMSDGRVVEDGTPADLLAEGTGEYAALAKAWRDSLV
jgi:ATP-binding cassette subfamily B protein